MITGESSYANLKKLQAHIVSKIKDRSLRVLSVDEHQTATYFRGVYDKIDEPRKYPWQDEFPNESRFIDLLENYFERMSVSDDATLEDDYVNEVMTSKDTPRFIVLRHSFGDFKCFCCGANIYLAIRHDSIVFMGLDKCDTSHMYYTIDVDFPTGEVVYDDMPAGLHKLEEKGIISKGNGNVNYLSGTHKASTEMAKSNILFMFVGNTCPGLHFRKSDSAITIGDGGKGFTNLGTFCTDLWWVTMLDKEVYLKLLKKGRIKVKESAYKVVKVKPGRYRFTACYGMGDKPDDYNYTEYVRAEYLGPIDTVS
jgi:hypothetical protein